MFCRSVELGSFTAASKALGMTPQAASRAVSRLEASLGVSLFRRSTRMTIPTEDGQIFYERCRAGLTILEDATAALTERGNAAESVVRISMPTPFGHFRILPALADFRRTHPNVRIEAQVANHNVDFVREGYDLAVRMGQIDSASFVARSLGRYSLGLFASPEYLARAGRPETIAALLEHDAIVFTMPSTGRRLPWEFAGGRSFTPRPAWICSDDFLACITLARNGAGVVQCYHFLVERELASGELVEVLPEVAGFSRACSLVYPKGTTRAGPVRAVVDHLLARLRDDAGALPQRP